MLCYFSLFEDSGLTVLAFSLSKFRPAPISISSSSGIGLRGIAECLPGVRDFSKELLLVFSYIYSCCFGTAECLGFDPVSQFAVGTLKFELDAQKFEAEDFYYPGSRWTDEYLLDLNIPPLISETLLDACALSDTFHV